MLWVVLAVVAVPVVVYLFIRRHGALGFWRLAGKYPYATLAMFEEQDCWHVFAEKPALGYRSALPPGQWAGPFMLPLPWQKPVAVFGRVPDYEESQKAFVELMTKTLVAEPWRALGATCKTKAGADLAPPTKGATSTEVKPQTTLMAADLARVSEADLDAIFDEVEAESKAAAIAAVPDAGLGDARRMDAQWTKLLNSVKAFVNAAPDANLDGSGRCRTAWECYAVLRWMNGPCVGLYENSLVDPACTAVCRKLSEPNVTALLTWQWNEYCETNDPDVESPRQMLPEARRAALADVLREAVYMEAMSDGAAVEERQWI